MAVPILTGGTVALTHEITATTDPDLTTAIGQTMVPILLSDMVARTMIPAITTTIPQQFSGIEDISTTPQATMIFIDQGTDIK